MQARGRPGSGPEAINKPSPARHSRFRASSAAAPSRAPPPPRRLKGEGVELAQILFINQLWSGHRRL